MDAEEAALLHGDHSPAGLGRALIVFVPVYWAWVGMSVHANTRNVENPLDRIGILRCRRPSASARCCSRRPEHILDRRSAAPV